MAFLCLSKGFLLCCIAALMLQGVRAETTLTVLVTNLPSGWGTANGDSIDLIGTLNGWALGNSAVVSGNALRFEFTGVDTTALGSEWVDAPDGGNIGFRFVASSDIGSTLIKTDCRSNDGNFRLALQADSANIVEINAGPVCTLIDQDSAVWVNGVREREVDAIDRNRFAFPGGFWKALIMSYDDGHDQDLGLIPIFNQYGIKGTFHLCSEWLDQDTFISSEAVQTVYSPHEVSVHSVNHPDLTYVDDETVRWQVGHCRWVLSELVGYDTCSMSYPMGGYDNRILEQIAGQGITCSRTVEATFSLDYLPANPLKWHPTCHHANASGYADDFIDRTQEQMTLLFIWGHSYELDNEYDDNSWAYMTSLCQKLGHRGDIWYAGMEEVRAYLAAVQSLTTPADHVMQNPSALTIWAKPADTLLTIAPGKTITWPAGDVLVEPFIPYENSTLTLIYEPGDNALGQAENIYIHIGHDGWQDTQDIALSAQGDGTFSCEIPVSTGVSSLEWAFFDGGDIWDDNGGCDWLLFIRSGAAGTPAAIDLVEGSPVILEPASGEQNAIGETVDFTSGGQMLFTTDQGGFGQFGQIQVNCDGDYLYLGGTGMNPGGTNNAVLLFLQVDTLDGSSENLWNFTGTPYVLDYLHNAIFDPGMNLAILLGDEYGDGNFMHFNLDSGADVGQGVFYADADSGRFIPVPGVRLSQFDGATNTPTVTSDDDGNRQTDRWEVAIPWSSLNAPLGAASIGSCYLSGLIASDSVSGNDRYLSSNFLGAQMAGDLDENGNCGFNLVTLTGQRVGLVGADSDLDGMPDVWEHTHQLDAAGAGDADVDGDNDGADNREEYVADTDPTDPDSCFQAGGEPQASGFEVQCTMSPDRLYTLYSASNLSESVWTPVPGQGPRRGTGEADSMTDTNSAPQKYYRLRVELP